ncbi:MAG: prolipoprotein diacylglyceryl transferase [Candidatus Brocadiales bacterium]
MQRTLLEIPVPFLDVTIPVYSYGFMMMIGFLFAVLVARRKANYERVDPHLITDLGIYALVGGILGARALFIIHHFSEYAAHPLDIFMIFKGGLSFYGGLFVATATAAVFCKKRGLSPLKCLDMAAVGLAIGLAFGRIGCFLNGCCYGGRVGDNFLFRVAFPKTKDALGNVDGSPAFLHHLEEGWIGFADPLSLPVHPTQIYSALGAFMLFLILSNVYAYKKRDGEIFLLFLILYAPMRFYWEILRDDSAPVLYGLTVSQVIGIPAFLLALGLFIYGRRQLQKA